MDQYSAVLVIRELVHHPGLSQRELARRSGLSLGKINKTVREALDEGFIGQMHGKYFVNSQGEDFLIPYKVKNAVVMAAGFGSRCVPLTYETPKGLLPINGRPMIEVQIEQLLEQGITEILMVVGYMKEKFEYLIDRYGVELIYNPQYATKNNIASMALVLNRLGNTYILSADNYIEKSIFHRYEPDSWYCCLYKEGETDEWCITDKNKGRITKMSIGGHDEWVIMGPAYFSNDFSKAFSGLLQDVIKKPGTDDYYWENVLKEHLDILPIHMNCQDINNVHEFENMDELRQYDASYLDDSRNQILSRISEVFSLPQSAISGFMPLKEGMTNKSFVFLAEGKRYVLRLPGPGTEKLINRSNEKASYDAIAELNISDKLVYFDAETGCKISEYFENSRTVNIHDRNDWKAGIDLVKRMHHSSFAVDHQFNMRKMIRYYVKIAEEIDAIHFQQSDFTRTQSKVEELLCYLEGLPVAPVLCHGDFVFSNIMMLEDGSVKLIDWEYSGMADPLLDLAMFILYSDLSREDLDFCLEYYFDRKPTRQEKARAYSYVALGGFLWCMWSEYKQGMGEEFGEYTLKMYRYMKDYYEIIVTEDLMQEK